ncbi:MULTISPECIES: branched-chain amino acid transport system II carrier protein [Clostridia]|uniref:branched-chain amino acid transport system II carrier protein n=1 Tax=Clostridia TaxID=186801 RepID=UPI000EA03EF4|nr:MULTISPECIES: branched-chain amino acid transport system II carrier protein [Clostridia]NBJ67958.1 branched-chain amino acid transport system II carrier protein [Roseburia sp. 1XD42-34]RKI82404.1 branched-chain amino acid transport system II carrier protein [Clostridium sp. 1xD42-85]
MNNKLSFSTYLAIGVMLFALFFGAGNLIFPAQLGQLAGDNVWQAVTGFLITGVGLPLLGILAMSFSGSESLQDLAGRVHPVYGVLFTSLLYLTIGPFFAAPRTATVAFDVGFSSFMTEEFSQIGLFLFSFLFFVITMLFSLYPAKIVDYVGKLLAPGIVILLLILLTMVVAKPMGNPQVPQGNYLNGPFLKGFLEGYNTMDALASLVFGIIVIKAIRSFGVTSKTEIIRTTAKAGSVAIALLAAIYIGIAYLGATSTGVYGIFETGGAVLSSAATHYFGTFGMVLLAIVITLACLTTSIGLTTACSEYFHSLYPKLSYRKFVFLFTIVTFTIANFGLTNIITYSIPVLMLLYPLAIVLMLLAFLSPLFNHKRAVYISVTLVTLCISLIDGLKSLCDSLGIAYFPWLKPVISFYKSVLPLYNEGLGWLIPALIVLIISGTVLRVQKASTVHAS